MHLKSVFPLVVAVFFLWVGCAAAAPTLSFKIAAGDPEDSEMGVVGQAFKEYVEAKTEGNVEIHCFYSGALGDESECLRNVQKGTLPLAMAGIANLVPFEKKLGLLTLPYLFSNIDEVVTGTNGAPAALLDSYAAKSGFRILTWTYTDFRYISNSKRPITKKADMQGLKFRVPQSAVLIAAYKAFGGSPTPISWSETFTALQQGVVDGQCYGYIGFKANKFNEANQKYLTEVHYTYQLQPLVISERVFRKLDPELQKILTEAGRYAQEKVLKYQIKEADAAKKYLISNGLQVSQLEDEDMWKKAAIEKVWPEMADFVGGKEVINAYLKACGKPSWK